MMVYGVPMASDNLGRCYWRLFRKKDWSVRRWLAYGGFAFFLAASLLFRVGEMDAAFAFQLGATMDSHRKPPI